MERPLFIPAQETALPIDPEEVPPSLGRETPAVSGDVPFARDAGGVNISALPPSGLLTDAGGTEVSPDMPGEASPAGARFGPGNFVSDVLGPNDPLNKQLAEQFRQKFEAESYAGREATARLEQDRRRMDDAFQRSSAMRDDPALKPWNADQERADRIRGPMEQFGSVGMVFAMAASMFTKAPMTSALNAGAAAMRSIQEHDEKGYDSAYAAWKANSDLALKRFDMERNLFHDANQMATTDLQTWAAKRLAIAAQFEDQKAITFLENGMYREVLELDEKKIKMADELRKYQQGFEEFNIQRSIFSDGVKAFEAANPNATESQKVQNRLQLLHEIKSGARSWQQEALRNFELTNPNATPEERAKFMQSLRAGSASPGGNQDLTTDRQRAADVKKYREELTAEKNEDGSRKYTDKQVADMAAQREKELKASSSPPTSNQRDKIASQITRFDLANSTVDKIEGLLKKHKALTGLGGKITRPAEVVGNWFGNNETDRAQFRRYISELQEWGARLLNESGGRPLSAEEQRITTIIPGLNAGDTTANTARGLHELQGLLSKMREQLRQRYEGSWTPEGSKEGAGSKTEKPDPTKAKPKWQDAPVAD